MTPWNGHGIDWTAYDEEEKAARRCGNGEWYTLALGVLLILAGLIWWVAECP